MSLRTKLLVLFGTTAEDEAACETLAAALKAAEFWVHAQEKSKKKAFASPEKHFLLVAAERDLLEQEAELTGMLKAREDGQAAYFSVGRGAMFKRYEEESFFTEAEEALLIESAMRGRIDNFATYRPRIEAVVPLRTSTGAAVWRQTPWLSLLPSAQEPGTRPSHAIVSYFGFGMGFYFEWLNSFTIWLLAPATVGTVLAVRRRINEVTLDEDWTVAIYALFVVFWAVLFVRFWERRVAYLHCQWGLHFENRQKHLQLEDRLGHLPRRDTYLHRLASYAVSALVTSVGLGIAFGVMICSLNLQGYIHNDTWTERPFYMPSLARLAEPGAVFGPDGGILLPLVPTVLHVAVILGLNTLYREVAEVLTQWENHRTEVDFEYSLAMKRFFFEAFDCYIALCYLGFAQFDLPALRTELVSLYSTDQLRRVLLETVVPGLLNYMNAAVRYREAGVKKKTDDVPAAAPGPSTSGAGSDGASWKKQVTAKVKASLALPEDFEVLDVDMAEYEDFDDYLEMVIEFGYITLFASAFPLAPLASLLCNFIEAKSDLYKVCFVYRRPEVKWSFGIGPWLDILKVLAALSVATNCFLFSFSSEQIVAWIPQVFIFEKTHVEEEDAVLRAGSGRYLVALCFGIEHVVAFLCFCLYYLIPGESETVRQEKQRLRRSKATRERDEAEQILAEAEETAKTIRKDATDLLWDASSATISKA